MDKAYNHNQFEDNIYQAWEDSGNMKADNTSEKKPFTIPLPPPNVTGQLHLGHAAMLAIEDIMIRYKKMTGHESLWVPGTDHAAIATESVVIKHLGLKSREELSREDFLEECKAFASEKHDTIVNQMKKMGAWLDWSREAYTFDKERNHGVNTIFKMLYEDGLIEKGYRMINWSVGAQSVLADDELEYEDRHEPFYYIKCGEFIIGTVRSETKCADSPLVVHPDGDYVRIKYTPLGEGGQGGVNSLPLSGGDVPTSSGQRGSTFIISKVLFEDKDRLSKTLNLLDGDFELVETMKGKDLVGQAFEYDTYAGKRKFYVLADEMIDMEKGTGSMTISVNHSPDDYDLAQKHDLKDYYIDKIGFDGKMTAVAGELEGMYVNKARRESAKIMKEKGLLVGEDDTYQHRVPLCYRSNSVVEPMISPQWFVMVEKEFTDRHTGQKTTLKKLTADAVRENHVKIIPERFNKIYFHWIDNLRDWCISRQIWWGHQIPVWYDKAGEVVAVGDQESPDPTWKQDEDTLDTWFSSALWPFSTVGWPDEKNPDFEKFYPMDVLETGHDILFFWVARMIMFGRYATGKYPFSTVYLHGMVCDEHGKKMSKSKGNGIDPLEAIEEVGADAVRLSLVIGSTPGNPIPLGKNKIKGYRNFVNKMWNAGRFVSMQIQQNLGDQVPETELDINNLPVIDRWIFSRFSEVAQKVQESLENYDISKAGDTIYHFVWDDFCDWYIEASKASTDPKQSTMAMYFLFGEILKLVHPICPFISEQLWKTLYEQNGSLTDHQFPTLNILSEDAERSFAKVQEIVQSVRKLRTDNAINPKDKVEMWVKISDSILVDDEVQLRQSAKVIEVLARASEVHVGGKSEIPESATKIVLDQLEVFVALPVDEEADAARKEKEIAELKKQITALEGRLSNKAYTDKAPKHLVDETKDQLAKAKAKLSSL